MTGRQSTWTWGSMLVGLAVIAAWYSFGQAADAVSVKPEQLLPADSLIYVSALPGTDYQSAYEKTASHEALYKSGLMATLTKLVNGVVKQIPAEQAVEIQTAMKTVLDKGVSLAVWVPAEAPAPIPAVTFVFHESRSLEKSLTAALTAAADKAQTKVSETSKTGRTVRGFALPDTPGLQINWWVEGEHLVLVAGLTAADPVIALAEGKGENITANPLWKKYREKPADPEQVLSAIAWLDIPRAVQTYGKIPLPREANPQKQLFVSDFLKLLSLNEYGPFVLQSGFRGKSSWSVATLEYVGETKGEESIVPTISLADFPPLPVKTHTFFAGRVDLSGVYTDVLKRVRGFADLLAPPPEKEKLEKNIQQLPEVLGFDPKADLLDGLGNVYCFYQGGSLLQSSAAFVMEVRDAERLKKTLDGLQQRIPERAPVRVVRTPKEGRELVTITHKDAPVGINYCIDKKWLIVSADPQTVHAFLLRLDGKLDHWKPTAEHSAAFADLPQKFRSIMVTDPRAGLDLVVGLAPLAVGALETFANLTPRFPIRIPISQIDFPPAEVVSKPLFPNVTVTVSDSKKWQSISRESLSLNANGGAATVGVAAIGVALVLPAVQQAREAARGAQSRNHLKQIGLSVHNFESSYRVLPPRSTDARRQKIPAADQVSWFVDILPFLEQNNVYNRMDLGKPWNSPENKTSAQTSISQLLNPAIAPTNDNLADENGYPVTHYVGNGGLGADGPTLGIDSPKAGFFAFNRKTSFRDIKDGLSNTIMAAETYKKFGPWAANTTATIRPLTKKPYIHGEDGFGSPNTQSGTMTVIMGDGSVRTLSKTIDPAVLEALQTINGGDSAKE